MGGFRRYLVRLKGLIAVPALKPPDAGGYFRFHKLGEGYSLDEIKERILHNLQKQVLGFLLFYQSFQVFLDLPGTLGDAVT